MKTLTLDQTWKDCLAMWRWIDKYSKNADHSIIANLKREWLRKHNYNPGDICACCFFCQYVRQNDRGCQTCPGVDIDEKFHCSNYEYDWSTKPHEFYLKLRRMYRIYKKANK